MFYSTVVEFASLEGEGGTVFCLPQILATLWVFQAVLSPLQAREYGH